MPLPVLTTAEDVTTLVSYLKTKPTGATLAEAKAAIKKQTLDGRKLTAYTLWGFIAKDGERMKLTTRGWEYARKPETEQEIYRQVIDSIPPYKSVLEWAFHQKMESMSNVDVVAHWHEHHSEALGTDNENSIKDSAVCFFHICESAGLGTMKSGRRGQTTRIDLNREQLRQVIEAGPSTPPWTAKSDETIAKTQEVVTDLEVPEVLAKLPASAADGEEPHAKPPVDSLRVFVSHGSNMNLVEQVQTMLEIADIQNEIAVKEESSAIPVPEKVFGAMRRCTAGIIVVSVDETRTDKDGAYTINENVLMRDRCSVRPLRQACRPRLGQAIRRSLKSARTLPM